MSSQAKGSAFFALLGLVEWCLAVVARLVSTEKLRLLFHAASFFGCGDEIVRSLLQVDDFDLEDQVFAGKWMIQVKSGSFIVERDAGSRQRCAVFAAGKPDAFSYRNIVYGNLIAGNLRGVVIEVFALLV